jgi:hypothetical protein
MDMEKIEEEYFQFNNQLVIDTYANQTNCLIEYDNHNTETKKCAIYFSSNDLYFPNTVDVFNNEIILKNKFEWFRSRYPNVHKHIFIRDIKKQWYIEGINKNQHDIYTLFEFLKQECEGLEIITIGSSAGGFAAVIFGQLLNASMIYSFNGQFEIESLLKHTNFEENPVLHFRCNDKHFLQWYACKKHLINPENIYYFNSNLSKWDNEQKNYIKDIVGLNIIEFNSKNHGLPFYRFNIDAIFNLSQEELVELSTKTTNPITFSISHIGIVKTTREIINLYWNYILKLSKRKILQYWKL